MKFLLAALNAKYIHSNPAIYSLRAYAGEELQEYIELAEYTINNHLQDILADIYRRKPDVVGFSCYIWNWKMIQELLRELPKLLPQTDIWLGGPEVSYDAEQILKDYPQVAGIMIGEGEATFRELLQSYIKRCAVADNCKINISEESKPRNLIKSDATKSDIVELSIDYAAANTCMVQKNVSYTGRKSILNDSVKKQEDFGERFCCIPGLYLRTGYTPMRELTDMSKIPFLYSDLEPFENRIIYYETSRGCPYRCSYCLSSIDKVVRLRDINVVKKELQFFLDNKVPQVKFVDRTFNCNHDHAMAVWQYIHEHDNGVTNFHFEISADILREDEIALLQKLRPGLAQLEIGVQSVNEKTISAINRVMNVDKLEKIVASVHKGHNIHQHLDLIAGLPYEDYESFGKSFDRVYAMKPEQLQLGFLKVLKGSEMCERAEEFGISYLSEPPYEVLYTKWLSYEEILRLKKIEEMVELYYNSNQFTHTLLFLQREFAGPFAMFEALADFYECKGFFTNSPARAYRYNVLLQFAEETDAEHADIYKELLTYDMYLRENLKSRPIFATDLSVNEESKNAVREFYRKEEQERKWLPDYAEYDWKQLSKMTHLELFRYPVWDVEALSADNFASEQDAGYGVLFDYRKRDPLTYEAGTQII